MDLVHLNLPTGIPVRIQPREHAKEQNNMTITDGPAI